MSADPRDVALMAACPCLAVPLFGELPQMSLGQRILVASNGVFSQTRLDWLDCTLRIAPLPPSPPLPYGTLRESIQFAFRVIPLVLLDEFVKHGRDGLPNEIAGGLIYSIRTNRLRLQIYEAIEAGPCGIQYRMPELHADERIAVDLHTHGRLPAFWSSVDDADDRGVKVSGVFGSLHEARPTARFRLVVNGMYRDLPHPWKDVDDATADETLVAFTLNRDTAWST